VFVAAIATASEAITIAVALTASTNLVATPSLSLGFLGDHEVDRGVRGKQEGLLWQCRVAVERECPVQWPVGRDENREHRHGRRGNTSAF